MCSDKFPHYVSELFAAFIHGEKNRVIGNSLILLNRPFGSFLVLSSPLLSWGRNIDLSLLFYLVIQIKFVRLLQVPSSFWECFRINLPRERMKCKKEIQEVLICQQLVEPAGLIVGHVDKISMSKLLITGLAAFTASSPHESHHASLSLCFSTTLYLSGDFAEDENSFILRGLFFL